MRTLVIVQARTSSTRLPGKVMLPLAGRPLLQRLIERVLAARTPSELAVATTQDAQDEKIVELCRRLGVRCFRGHPTDLLDRHYRAGQEARADVVVKIPSDCPLIDPSIVDRVLGCYQQSLDRWDFASNLHPPTYPDGNDVEVIPMGVLETAWRESVRPLDREHTTPFIWDRPERFRIGNVRWETGLDFSMSHRFTVDYPEDHALVAAVFKELWSPRRVIFGLDEILQLLADRPELAAINARYLGVNWYRHHLRELKTVSPSQTRLPRSAP